VKNNVLHHAIATCLGETAPPHSPFGLSFNPHCFLFFSFRHKLTVEAWRAARIAEVMEEFTEQQLMEWHNVKSKEELWKVLLHFSDQVLVQRFSKVGGGGGGDGVF
jgi:hypothetical protein